MSKIEVHNRVSDFNSYRAARVKSLFNAENGCNFDLEVDVDLDFDWNIGVVVGASGSGKTSIGKIIFGEDKIYDYHNGWDHDKPIIDCIAPDGTELIVAAHSHWIISDRCLAKCKYGGIGFHPSLLPRHRGRDAVRWAVHMGDFVTGATVYSLDGEKCDGGDILLQETVFIDPEWDYHKLWENIFPIGVKMVVEAVDVISKGACKWKKQDERFATFEPSWERPRLVRNELIAIEAH